MAIDIQAIFSAGGRPLMDLLEYCVFSIQLDPIFDFLVRDYRNLPSAPKATAIFDVFCQPQAPGRIGAHKLLPPFDQRLSKEIDHLRQPFQRTEESVDADGTRRATTLTFPRLPPKYLFDAITAELARSSESLRRIGELYDPRRTPIENLPGGVMTAGQKQFVDQVWQPRIRPQLISAGFFRVADIA